MATRTIRVYLSFSALFAFFLSFEFSYYVVFLQKHGLSFFEAGLVNGFFMAMAFLFEIPTGVVADYFGRKTSVLLGVLVSAAGNLAYGMSESMPGFLVAEGLFALGLSFRSGALEAWVTDELNQAGDTKRMTGVFSSGEIYSRVATMAGGFIGGAICIYDMHLPWLVSGAGDLGIAIAFSFIMKEEFFKKNERRSLKDGFFQMKKIFTDSIAYGYRNKAVWNLILLNTLFILGTQAYNFLWSPHAESLFGKEWLGTGYFLISFAVVAGCLATRQLKNRFSDKKTLVIALCVTGAAGMATAFNGASWVIALFFLIHEFGRGLYMPVQQALFQSTITNKDIRATVGSFSSMVGKSGAAIGWIGAGIAADYLAITQVWAVWAFAFFAASIFVGKLNSKK